MQTSTSSSEEKSQRTWVVRPFVEDDLEGLLSLYKQVFGRERRPEEFRWKVLGQESPVDTVWVAADGNRIVGQHAGIPIRLKLGSRTVFVMHAVEAMTDDDYRRQGMLTILGGGLYGHWREHGVPIIMGLPHPGWGTRAYALGYRSAFPLLWLSRPIRPLALLLSKVGISRPRVVVSSPEARRVGAVSIAPVSHAGPEFDALWQAAGSAYMNCVVRNGAWVQWRYLDQPFTPFTVLLAKRGDEAVGYISYRLAVLGGRPIGRLADIFVRPEDSETASALIGSAIDDLRAQGAESASILVAAGSHLHSLVRSNGFLLKRGSYDASFIQLTDEIDLAELKDPAQWLLTGGDFDVV